MTEISSKGLAVSWLHNENTEFSRQGVLTAEILRLVDPVSLGSVLARRIASGASGPSLGENTGGTFAP